MSRLSGDEYRAGAVWDGYDYDLQVWVVGGIVKPCSHPTSAHHGSTCPRPAGATTCSCNPCCNQARYAGHLVATIPGQRMRS